MAEEEARGSGEPGTNGENVVSKAQDAAGSSGLIATLTKKEVLIPVAATAATALGGLAARRGGLGEKVKQFGGDTAENLGARGAEGAKEQLGGAGGIAGAVLSKAPGMDRGHGRPKTRRLQIQRWTDVAVPVERAYEAWTEFDEYPKFMHRALTVRREDDKVTWSEKIWFSKREWEAEIVEQRDNEFIAWRTTSGAAHAGVISFHELEDRLTRVMVTMDFRPTGMIEKMASGLRFVKRAVQADLARFKSYVEFKEAGLDAPQERLEQIKQEEDEEKDKDKDKQKQGRRQQQQQDGGREQRGESSDDEDRDAEAERSERESRRAERREQAAV